MEGREYLAFTKKERSGILALVFILVAVIIVPKFFKGQSNLVAEEITSIGADSVQQLLKEIPVTNSRRIQYPSQQVSKPESRRDTIAFRTLQNNADKFGKSRGQYKPKSIAVVELNSADTTQLIALPFIGGKLAARIVTFRDKLGGFTSVEQIAEVYGLSDTAFMVVRKFLTCDATKVKKISINQVDVDALKTHPYIRWQLAKLLINYRSNHGPYRKTEDFFRINGVDSSFVNRISPYMQFDDSN
jgi:competence protein ComEA